MKWRTLKNIGGIFIITDTKPAKKADCIAKISTGGIQHTALIAAAPELLGLAYAILSYCQDDSRSERRRKAIIDSTKELINKAKRSE